MTETGCPVCHSERIACAPWKVDGIVLELCLNCSAFWEAETRQPEEKATPCDNCAFRPGSPERANRENWSDLLVMLIDSPFYCHKRVPCEFVESGEGYRFKVERAPDGSVNAEACMGFVAMALGRLSKLRKLEGCAK